MNTPALISMGFAVFLPISSATAEVTFTRVDAGDIGADALHSQTVAWGDYDGDGWVDLFAGFNTFMTDPEAHRLYHNNGDGTFTRVLDGGIADDPAHGYGSAAVWADFENDGDLDLFVAQHNNFQYPSSDQFYLNNGDGTFARSGQDWIPHAFTSDAAWGDHDNDGLLDLLVDGYETAFLYHQQPDGSMVSIEFADFTNKGYSRVGWSDYDDDNDLDIFVSASDVIYRNDGDGEFTADTLNYQTNLNATMIGDYDNDDDLDLAKVIFRGEYLELFQNNRDGTWTAVPNAIARPGEYSFRPGNWADYDNDGYLDLFIPTTSHPGLYYDANRILEIPNLLLHNEGDGTFTHVTEGALVNDFGMSYASAWADYDNDGDLDVVLADGQTGGRIPNPQVPAVPVALYRNDGGNDNNWINLTLVGTVSNRSAIGAKVFAQATINGVAMQQMREVGSGQGGNGQCDLRVHFGLGDADVVDTLRIEWPSGGVQVMQDLEANRFLTIEEDFPAWAGYPIVDGAMNVDTGNFLGWVNVYNSGDYVWSYGLSGWVFCPEADVSESGAWVYVPK